jgi:hypothetical protein
MPRAKLRKGGKWHEQHRLCCVTHGMRVRLLQSGTVYTNAGCTESLRVTSWYLTTLYRSAQDCMTIELQQRLNQRLWYAGEGRHHRLVDAAKHRCSFGDPRTRPSAAGAARRHSPGARGLGFRGLCGTTVWVSMPDSRRDRRRSRSRKSKPLRTDHRLGRGHIDRARVLYGGGRRRCGCRARGWWWRLPGWWRSQWYGR